MHDTSLVAELARLADFPAHRIAHNERLAPRTGYRIGGPATAFATAQNAGEAQRLAQAAHHLGIDCHVLGRGTNLLVADAGVKGLVLALRADTVTMQRDGLGAIVNVEAGVELKSLALRMCSAGLGGLVFGGNIPGTVGGAITGNAGAFGGCMSDVVTAVRALDAEGTMVEIPAAEAHFTYRYSRFREPERRRETVLGATLRLPYANTRELLAQVEANRQDRERKQPWGRCAGSVFRNPAEGPAGKLIEMAGLKGHKVGGARVSVVHANFIMNDFEATAADVIALIEVIQERVLQQTGISLELEIQLWGFD